MPGSLLPGKYASRKHISFRECITKEVNYGGGNDYA